MGGVITYDAIDEMSVESLVEFIRRSQHKKRKLVSTHTPKKNLRKIARDILKAQAELS